MFRNLIVSAISAFAVLSFVPLYAENIQHDYTSKSYTTHSPPPEVYIPPGTFMMGSPVDEPCREPWGFDETQHQVTLTYGFHMMTTEVTRQMWADIRSMNEGLPIDQSDKSVSPTMAHPVQSVSWWSAILFANLMSLRDGYERCYYKDCAFAVPVDWMNYHRLPIYCNFNANGYRLPTEAEWEYACRAGTTGPFSTHEPNYSSENCHDCQADPPLAVLDSIARWCGDLGDGLHYGLALPVGSKLPNPWGLYDMHGNMSEWCWDWKSNYPSGPEIDPLGPTAEGGQRVIRGGNFADEASPCRSAWRTADGYFDFYIARSFRLVRTSNGIPSTHIPCECDWLGTRLELSQDTLYRAGDTFWLKCHVCVDYHETYSPISIVLGVFGEFWFWDDSALWYKNFRSVSMDLYPPLRTFYVIRPFRWPSVEGHVEGLEFYSALLTLEKDDIIGEYDYVTFGYTDR